MPTIESLRTALEVAKLSGDKKPLMSLLYLEFMFEAKKLITDVEEFLQDEMAAFAAEIVRLDKGRSHQIRHNRGIALTRPVWAFRAFTDRYEDIVVEVPFDYIVDPVAGIEALKLRLAAERAAVEREEAEREREARLREYKNVITRFDELRQEFGDLSIEALLSKDTDL